MSTATEKSEFVFREITTPDELLAAFRLRYEVYRDSRLKGFCAENDEGIDVDPWDARARHFGLFPLIGSSRGLLGYIRVVESCETPAAASMQTLAHEYQEIAQSVATDICLPFPQLTYSGEARVVTAMIEKELKRGSSIVEPARLVLATNLRSIKAAMFIVECAVARYFLSSRTADIAILTCASSQKKAYQRYGFDNIPGTTDCFWEKPGVKGSALMATPGSVPEKLRPRLRAMAREFDTTGRITFRSGRSGKRRSDFRTVSDSKKQPRVV